MDKQLNEQRQLRLHRIRTKLVTFKELVKEVFKTKSMTLEQFVELNIAAQVSSDYQDSLTLNKLTVIFPAINQH